MNRGYIDVSRHHWRVWAITATVIIIDLFTVLII
jgi:hypothetical protein